MTMIDQVNNILDLVKHETISYLDETKISGFCLEAVAENVRERGYTAFVLEVKTKPIQRFLVVSKQNTITVTLDAIHKYGQ